MDEAQFALVSSIFTLGGLLGALSAGPLSTHYGRLLTMRISALFYLSGSVFSTLAPSIALLSTGRLLSGIGAGACVVVVPIYISEVAPPSERGLFGFLTQIMTNLGILFTQTLGYFFSATSLWRIILAVGGVIAVFLLVGLFFVPESPVWTAANRDPQRAISTLQRIRGSHFDISEEIQTWDCILPSQASTPHLTESAVGLLDAEIPSRRSSLNSKASSHSKSSVSVRHIGIFEVARDPLYRRAIIAVVGVMFAQQFSGINSVMMYSVSLLSDLFPSTSALLTILISVVNLLTTIASAPLPDLLGRKKSLLLSFGGMGISSLCLGASILFAIPVFSAVSVLLFVASFACGVGPIPFMLASELVGTEAKGATQSWALGANWIGTYLVAQFFPILNAAINKALGGSGWMYFVFAGVAFVSVGFVGRFVPETRGKKDADEVWGRRVD